MNTVSNDSVSSPGARLDENPIQLVRLSTLLSPEGKEIRTECEEFENNKCACDFPALNPLIAGSRQEHTYLAAASGRRQALPYFPFDTLVKLSGHDATEATVSSWFAGKRSFVGEPIFVPRSKVAKSADSPDFQEDDGYLLTIQVSTQIIIHFMKCSAQIHNSLGNKFKAILFQHLADVDCRSRAKLNSYCFISKHVLERVQS
jgi:hypothetical protein